MGVVSDLMRMLSFSLTKMAILEEAEYLDLLPVNCEIKIILKLFLWLQKSFSFSMKQRLKCFYKKTVISQLLGRFHYKNIHKVPRVEKIVINRGLGEIRQNRSLLKSSL